MTKQPATEGTGRCKWCRRVLVANKMGRPRQFCSQACRQGHWVGGQRAIELELSEDELIVAREELDSLHDDLYVLACAVLDADRDLASSGSAPSARELGGILHLLLEAARPLAERELGPPRQG